MSHCLALDYHTVSTIRYGREGVDSDEDPDFRVNNQRLLHVCDEICVKLANFCVERIHAPRYLFALLYSLSYDCRLECITPMI